MTLSEKQIARIREHEREQLEFFENPRPTDVKNMYDEFRLRSWPRRTAFIEEYHTARDHLAATCKTDGESVKKQGLLFDAFKKDCLVHAEKYHKTEYVAPQPFLTTLKMNDVGRIVKAMKPKDVRALCANSKGYDKDCMLWSGARSKNAHTGQYGPQFSRVLDSDGKKKRARRNPALLLYHFMNEPLKCTEYIERTCVNPLCVNPFHHKSFVHRSNGLKRKRE